VPGGMPPTLLSRTPANCSFAARRAFAPGNAAAASSNPAAGSKQSHTVCFLIWHNIVQQLGSYVGN
jgi:hypothetical protein